MFTGIVEEIGTIGKIGNSRGSRIFEVKSRSVRRTLRVGDSVALNGVCLTVIRRSVSGFAVQAVEETLRKTTLGDWKIGGSVNLERPVRAGAAMGGHFVLGHVDATCRVQHIERRGSSRMVWIRVAKRFRPLLIPVGSVAVNGVSLTVADLQEGQFGVSLIPHTLEVTNLGILRIGDRVNVEFDVLGKYVRNIVH